MCSNKEFYKVSSSHTRLRHAVRATIPRVRCASTASRMAAPGPEASAWCRLRRPALNAATRDGEPPKPRSSTRSVAPRAARVLPLFTLLLTAQAHPVWLYDQATHGASRSTLRRRARSCLPWRSFTDRALRQGTCTNRASGRRSTFRCPCCRRNPHWRTRAVPLPTSSTSLVRPRRTPFP